MILFVIAGDLYAQISPGELAAAHSELEGMSNCVKCHVLGKSLDNLKCLKCHRKIEELINIKHGYHANPKVANKNCWKCHGDHFGRNFKIIKFDENKFKHSEAGYELKGKHKNLKCNKCHNYENISDAELKTKEKTFLGLQTDCASCHEDVHRKTLGKDCANCHTEEKFKPAVKFNHDNTDYKLTGKHKNVLCENCHPVSEKDGKTFQKFKGIKYNTCKSCHEDVHKGKFGNKCSSCHNTKSFADVGNIKSFNHSLTNFPLIGKHKKVKCKSCHKGSLSYKPKYRYCYNCHEDYHKGEFKVEGEQKDCAECHNEKGFSPSYFTIEMHNKSGFKLLNAHAAVPCYSCHYSQDMWHFKIEGEKCIVCHENIHESFISKKFFDENKCESCHLTTNWHDVKFNHDLTDFKLLGKHKELECSQCHYEQIGSNKFIQHFSDLKTGCENCHTDVHNGQFDKTDEYCTVCHTFENWEPTLFDHNETGFKLEGAHANLECSQCHFVETKNNVRFIRYKLEDTRCISCHT